MTDFFISYTARDEGWAEWISYVLEDKGFKVIIQAWDMRPGSNFILEMQQVARSAKRTILVLSPDFLKSGFTASEWAAAFAQDPQGLDQRIVPIMVRDCEPEGLLRAIVQIRLVDLEEDTAKEKLLRGVDQKRAKPSKQPIFPGFTRIKTAIKTPAAFPGNKPLPTPEFNDKTVPLEEEISINKRKKRFIFGGKISISIAITIVSSISGLAIIYYEAFGPDRSALPNLAGYDSPSMGGGHSPDEQCGPLRDKYAAENPKFNIIIHSWEDHDKDFLGHVTYRYHCRYSAILK